MASPIPSIEDAVRIQTFRLLIARAAQNDSLRWWEDDSLTDAGDYLLKRLFTNAPTLAGRKLALLAAHARHKAVFKDRPKAIHLFRLDTNGDVELALRGVSLESIQAPIDPIDTPDALRAALEKVLDEEPAISLEEPRSDGSIEVRTPNQLSGPLAIAEALSWAYLNGDREKPVFPYLALETI